MSSSAVLNAFKEPVHEGDLRGCFEWLSGGDRRVLKKRFYSSYTLMGLNLKKSDMLMLFQVFDVSREQCFTAEELIEVFSKHETWSPILLKFFRKLLSCTYLYDSELAESKVMSFPEIQKLLRHTNSKWEERIQAMRDFVIKTNQTKYTEEKFNKEFRKVKEPFCIQLKDRRSAVVREAAMAIGHMAINRSIQMTRWAPRLIQILFECARLKIEAISKAADDCIKCIVKHVPDKEPQWPILSRLTTGCEDANVDVRRFAMQYLTILIEGYLGERDSPFEEVWMRLKVLLEKPRNGLKDADEQVRFSAYGLLARGELAGVSEAGLIVSRLRGVRKRTYMKQKDKLRKAGRAQVILSKDPMASVGRTAPNVSSTNGARSSLSKPNERTPYDSRMNFSAKDGQYTSDYDSSTVFSIPSVFSTDIFSSSTVKGEMKSRDRSRSVRPDSRIRTEHIRSHRVGRSKMPSQYEEKVRSNKTNRSNETSKFNNVIQETVVPGRRVGYKSESLTARTDYSSLSSRDSHPEHITTNNLEPRMVKTRRVSGQMNFFADPNIKNTLTRTNNRVKSTANRGMKNASKTRFNSYRRDQNPTYKEETDPWNLKADDGFRVSSDQFPDPPFSSTPEADFADIEDDTCTPATPQNYFPRKEIRTRTETLPQYPKSKNSRSIVFNLQLENTDNFHKLERTLNTSIWDIKQWVACGVLEPEKLGARLRGKELWDDKATLGELGLNDNETLNLFHIDSETPAQPKSSDQDKEEQVVSRVVEPEGKLLTEKSGTHYIHIMRGKTYDNGLSLPANIVEPVNRILVDKRSAEIIYRGYPCCIRVSNWSDKTSTQRPYHYVDESNKWKESASERSQKTPAYERDNFREAFRARYSEKRRENIYHPSKENHEGRMSRRDRGQDYARELSIASISELRSQANKFTDRSTRRETDKVFKSLTRWENVNQSIDEQCSKKNKDPEFSDSSDIF